MMICDQTNAFQDTFSSFRPDHFTSRNRIVLSMSGYKVSLSGREVKVLLHPIVPVDEILPCGIVVEYPVDTLVRGHHQAGGSKDAQICLEAVVCPVREESPMYGPVYVVLCSGEAISPMKLDISGMTGEFPRLMGFRRLYGKPSIMRPSGRFGLCENDFSAHDDFQGHPVDTRILLVVPDAVSAVFPSTESSYCISRLFINIDCA